MPFPDRSDPDWTFDDSWQEEEPEPITAPVCPCCNGNGHASAHDCHTAQERLTRALEDITARGVEAAGGGALCRAVDAWERAKASEPTLTCAACFDTGVVESAL